MGARLRPPLVLAKNDLSVVDVMDHTRRHAIQADKAEATQDLLPRKQSCELRLVTESILQREESGLYADQRWEKLRELVIGGGLKSDDY
jgi:hypothetical protein